MNIQTWECWQCGWVLKFKKNRKDVSTWCDKCHEEMNRAIDPVKTNPTMEEL